jgi:flavin-dependent dehydrogenase
MEKQILSKNKRLEEYLTFKKLYTSPEVISQVNFNKKEIINNHILMVGDTSGLVVPLFGNGMSMALHAANKSSQLIHSYLNNKTSRIELENKYKKWCNKEFAFRLAFGRNLQRLLYLPVLSNPTLRLLNYFPKLANAIIKLTHGKNIIKKGHLNK